MKDENTRSNDASGYGISSENAWSNWMGTAARSALRRARERFRIRVEPHHLGFAMKTLEQHDQAARAAADFENAVARPDRGLVDNHRSRRVAADEFHERIVERECPVSSGRGEVGLSRICHGSGTLHQITTVVGGVSDGSPPTPPLRRATGTSGT